MTNATTERTYEVQGMSCSHCEAAVAEAVRQVTGVATVDADHGTGLLTVRGTGLSDETIRRAVDAAGYEVATP